jgi:peptidoglycan hydrolase-like protein with peptidoglycan-binding domain
MTDTMVLAAQQWVNETYKDVSGFVLAPEDGMTGWDTMHALTRALQHELGITALSSNFGPGTLGALTSYGAVSQGEPNQNLVKIIQSACYCKGYATGGITGTYGPGTAGAVSRLQADMGLSSDGTLPAKVFKGLLTMDAYVLLPGGNAGMRSAQQWLNNRYLSRQYFFAIPCDGHFSRDVQNAITLAIQFELGMSDDTATGNFGPATKAGLSANANVAQGNVDAAKPWVRLFRSLMIANRRSDVFNGTFDEDLTRQVSSFQEFTELQKTGTGDLRTWCELLVSTGDPNRPGTACDTITEITPARAKTLTDAGYRAVGRYLTNFGTLDKNIKAGELQTCFSAGLRVFPIFQENGRMLGDFSYEEGFQQALRADFAARNYGMPLGTTIYFAVDYDATQDEIESNILPYFAGIEAGLRSKGKFYAHGVYGSRNVCSNVTQSTFARYSFVSGMSTGFSGNLGFPLPLNWSFNQIQNLYLGSGDGALEIDKNIMSSRPTADNGIASLQTPATSWPDFKRYLDVIVAAAKQQAAATGEDHRVLVTKYLRFPEYNTVQWLAYFLDTADQSFNAVADAAIVQAGYSSRMQFFNDPMTFTPLKVTHWAASAESVIQNGKPAPGNIGWADIGGWAGDLLTLYKNYWELNQPDAYGWIRANMGKTTVINSFDNRNLLEDVDSLNIAIASTATGNFAETARTYYESATGGVKKRFTSFAASRFVSNQTNIYSAARDLFTSSDVRFLGLREFLLSVTVAETLPLNMPKVEAFCQGFADELLARRSPE